MPFGSPGRDVQNQEILQALRDIEAFEIDPREAVEAPRFGYAVGRQFGHRPHRGMP